ncbi:TM2 domain-containing protein [Paenibacillus sp. 1001270B_150601_E10]|uniref:TM2 domain-containing protein n=1 Tax=Paenibacillus sp. 1001270B_150601_E10 TaxID=2787079 RepID=UPI00189F1E80|nr:TM2 domain-containing protein [Paenibacillus sp. 1001270B_150601_E10]
MHYNIGMKSQLDTRELLLLEQEVKDRGKNMVIAYVLWYFLGMFGGHRFYMGRTGSAVAQLILTLTMIGAIVTFIWWIVDAFTLHTSVKEYNHEVENQVMHALFMSRPMGPGPGVF